MTWWNKCWPISRQNSFHRRADSAREADRIRTRALVLLSESREYGCRTAVEIFLGPARKSYLYHGDIPALCPANSGGACRQVSTEACFPSRKAQIRNQN